MNTYKLAAAAAAFLAAPAFGQFAYDELVDGDLSNDEAVPTPLIAAVGTNTVSGTAGGGALGDPFPADFADAFTFTVPAGFALNSVTVDTYVVAGGNTSSGLNFVSGTTWDGNFLAPNFITSTTITPASVGTDVLGTPLLAGDYTVSLREGTAGQTYALSFDIGVFTPPTPPPATSAFVDPTGSVALSLAPDTVVFYEIEIDGAPGTIDTFGSDFDTELGLYSDLGALVDTNDDAGGLLQSELDITGLTPGTYYLAVGGFNTEFNGGFNAAPDIFGFDGGNLVINGIAIPEPTSLALIGMGGLVALRRRRA
ncbi:MAG: PEP-CTERM sorting domain-containing protein [Planctomycetota bacterium]